MMDTVNFSVLFSTVCLLIIILKYKKLETKKENAT